MASQIGLSTISGYDVASMIVICEPLCQGISHEKVNSGFIYGLSLAFPGEKIRFYADATHIEAIKKILAHDNVSVDHIEYRTIHFLQLPSFLAIVAYAIVFSRLFAETIKLGANKVFFLSFSPETLYAIKKLKNGTNFAHLKFTFVLHGAFESIANDLPLSRVIALPRNSIPHSAKHSLFEKLRRTKFTNIPKIILSKIVEKLPKFPLPQQIAKFLTVKKMMEWNHTDDYKYIALSPHVTKNAEKYLNLEIFNFYTVILPTVFIDFAEPTNNEYAKFAIFGYGDSLVLHNLAYALTQKFLSKPYEIRVIGMDDRGIGGFVNVTCTGRGKRLNRDEMERQAKDIDVFLILYDKNKYRLSCSGSILESLSMVKPILHFDNECINQFNKVERPIGFCCNTFDEYVNKLAEIIENYDTFRPVFHNLRENILKQREECSIEKSVPQLKRSFSW